ncbi:hypothetical protein [Evansella halocellulosilytica]|uniref:hypothetical protein n=1 Tax=Evansella halocellulosilytica TaxID=2011013 RepID=UPI000BB86CD7|nr:hypothetical protein [Evansella halocellulosilytica]
MTTKNDLLDELEKRGMTDVVELITDAENGELEALELAPSLGLLRDDDLNERVINLLKDNGVEIIYVDEE